MSWILPTPESPMAEPGFWEPHSSSVDFCEPNYHLSKYIAEPHNALSSLFISLVGFIGMLYSNPLGEWPFAILFGHLFVIGLGK
jgi:dihydroceramidase